MFPCVIHNEMLVAFVSLAHAVTASTRRFPSPDLEHAVQPTSTPARRSERTALRDIRRPGRRSLRRAHSVSVRLASDSCFEPNADGASSRTASRICFRRGPSPAVTRRTSIPTQSSQEIDHATEFGPTASCHRFESHYGARCLGRGAALTARFETTAAIGGKRSTSTSVGAGPSHGESAVRPPAEPPIATIRLVSTPCSLALSISQRSASPTSSTA